jgi:4-hydroxyphenylpyruvate dioxygenase
MHHLAIEMPDLCAAVRRLRTLGTHLLGIPHNYYEDLAARVDLSEETLAELAELHILYDRDASGGELLHAYIGQLEGRFFVEILERRGGYGGYGAANAPVRLAAHAQQQRLESVRRVANM